MNPYKDSMMAFYTNRMMNDKNGGSIPDARLLLARRKLAVALEQGNVRKRNQRRPAHALEQGSRKRRNERRLALALL